MEYIALITVGFVIVAYVGFSVVDASLRRRRVESRVKNLIGTAAQREPDRQEESESLPAIAGILTSSGFANRLLLALQRAGLKLRPSEFIAIVSGISLGLALIAALTVNTAASQILAIAIGVLGAVAYVKGLQAKRLAAFNRQLPDALSMIGSAIRSGYAFARSLQVVADEMPAPINEEFKRVLDESRVGRPMDQALMAMLDRVPSYDLELVVVAVIIQQEVGGNLGEVIGNIGGTIRDRVRVEGELAALTAEGRLSGVVLQILPFAMAGVILVLNPKYLQPLIHDPMGRLLVLIGICLQVIGALVIRRILVLDY